MDYQVFLVRPSGLGGGSRLSKGVTRILRILEDGISISPIANPSSSHIEYQFEWMSNVLPSLDDDLEFKFDVVHINGRTETLKFLCDSRSALLTAILNKLDDVDSSGMLLRFTTLNQIFFSFLSVILVYLYKYVMQHIVVNVSNKNTGRFLFIEVHIKLLLQDLFCFRMMMINQYENVDVNSYVLGTLFHRMMTIDTQIVDINSAQR